MVVNTFSEKALKSRLQNGQCSDTTQVVSLTIFLLRYGAIYGPWHGSHGGKDHYFVLPAGEYINKVEGRSAKYVDQLKFTSSSGRTYGPYGGGGGHSFVAARPTCKLAYISGRCAKYVDRIVLHWQC